MTLSSRSRPRPTISAGGRLCASTAARRISSNLLYDARRFVRRLNELGIAHRYEEFADNHTGVDYRMDESLPFLAQALSGYVYGRKAVRSATLRRTGLLRDSARPG